MKFDLIIIGAGPGGYETAHEAACNGLKVALVNDGPLGGTCLNEGCIPTKALCKSAEDYAKCPSGGSLQEFFAGAQERKGAILSQLSQGIAMLMSHENITVFYGRASFAGNPKTVNVGEQVLEAENVIIATGSVNAVLPIDGANLCIDSSQVLGFKQLPSSMAIIGGGVIGLELASILATFGTRITILEYCPEILPRFDSEVAKRLRTALRKKGIEFVLSAKVTGVSEQPDGIRTVTYVDKKGSEVQISAEKVLMAAGRRPNIASLNFQEVRIEASPRGVVVDNFQRTSAEGVYAVGDICGGMMLAHVASFQGKVALDDIMTRLNPEYKSRNINLSIVPAAVFTDPMLASVGLAQQDCTEGTYTVHKSFYRANGKALCIGETEGMAKIMVDNSTDRILGATVLGASADLLIQQVADVMTLGGAYTALRSIVHAHPTLSEILIG